MPKFRFHKVAAIAVLIATAAWIATGEFSAVGSASEEATTVAERTQDTQAHVQTVTVATPPRVSHARVINVAGKTAADKRSLLAARIGGIVEELPFEKGQKVARGDVVLRLESEGREAAVAMAEQVLAQRKAEAEAAERLADSGNLARLQLDNARSALATAQSNLETAQAELSRITLRAPFDGILDTREVELGSSIAQGAEVATLVKLDPIIATGEVSENHLGTVNVGDSAEVRLVNGETVTGEVRYVSREASPGTRTFRVEVAIPNPDNAIPAGMTAEIAISAEPVETVALPRSVVTLNTDGELGVRGVNADNKVVFYPIDLVDDTPRALYLAGIPAEAHIIVAGQDLVTAGDTVEPHPADRQLMQELAGVMKQETN